MRTISKVGDEKGEKMDRKVRNSFWLLGILLFVVIIVGATFFKFSGNMGWIDSFYSTTLLLSTAGMGNIVPTVVSAKIFTIVFVLIGIPIVLFCLGNIIEVFLKSRLALIDDKMNEVIKEENQILKEEAKILEKEKDLLDREKK